MEVGSSGNPTENGAALKQREYSDDENVIDEWLLCPVSTDYVLFPQETINWCWVAAAQIACSKYMTTPITQASAAVYTKIGYKTLNPTQDEINAVMQGGLPYETELLLEYLLGSMDVYSAENRIYSEETLQSLLNNSIPVIIGRGEYINGVRQEGHATVIISCSRNDDLDSYDYEIMDPSPVGFGRTYWLTYDEICHDESTNVTWDRIVVIASGDYLDTIPSPNLTNTEV